MELQSVWFFIWGLLWAVFFITDGFDLGIGTLMPFINKGEQDKRIMINAMGPTWDGNEVWLLTAGGVTFAAFPLVYATMFSSLYTALMLVLFALILRGVSFEFRGQIDHPAWRKLWDTCIFIGSALPAILFGVAFANIFQGIPIDGDHIMQGGLLALINPYGLLGGVLFLVLFLEHGALWLAIKTEGELHQRAVTTARTIWPLALIAAVACLIFSAFATDLYANYLKYPILFLIIILAVAGLLGTRIFIGSASYFKAWVASAVTICSVVFYGIIGLFPRLLPSSIDDAFSLTITNASSSPLTLKIMIIVVILFVPVVIAYQAWAYHLFYHKVVEDDLKLEEAY